MPPCRWIQFKEGWRYVYHLGGSYHECSYWPPQQIAVVVFGIFGVLFALWLFKRTFWRRKTPSRTAVVAPPSPPPVLPITEAPATSPATASAEDQPIISKIKLEDFIKDKLEPPIQPTDLPKVTQTAIEFDEEKTDNGVTVHAFLLLSPEDIAIIEDKGLDEEVIEEEPAFDEERFELLEAAQAKEIAEAPHARARAGLRAIHKQQLADAKTWKLKLTIANYRAMERHFVKPLEATKWQNQLEQRVMQRVNQLLGHFREKATQSVRSVRS